MGRTYRLTQAAEIAPLVSFRIGKSHGLKKLVTAQAVVRTSADLPQLEPVNPLSPSGRCLDPAPIGEGLGGIASRFPAK